MTPEQRNFLTQIGALIPRLFEAIRLGNVKSEYVLGDRIIGRRQVRLKLVAEVVDPGDNPLATHSQLRPVSSSDEPTSDEPTSDEPTSDEPTSDEATVKESTVEASIADVPTGGVQTNNTPTDKLTANKVATSHVTSHVTNSTAKRRGSRRKHPMTK